MMHRGLKNSWTLVMYVLCCCVKHHTWGQWFFSVYEDHLIHWLHIECSIDMYLLYKRSPRGTPKPAEQHHRPHAKDWENFLWSQIKFASGLDLWTWVHNVITIEFAPEGFFVGILFYGWLMDDCLFQYFVYWGSLIAPFLMKFNWFIFVILMGKGMHKADNDIIGWPSLICLFPGSAIALM